VRNRKARSEKDTYEEIKFAEQGRPISE